MKEYYVDVENVGIKWIDIYKEMSKNDKMIIYFSKHTHFSYNDLMSLLKVEQKKLELKEAFVRGNGDSALDYFLMGDLQNNMNEFPKREYIIVSNDKDYDDFISEKRENKFKIDKILTDKQVIQTTKNKEIKSKNNNQKTNLLDQLITKCFTKAKLENNQVNKEEIIKKFIQSNGNFNSSISHLTGKTKTQVLSSITKKDRTKMKKILLFN